MGSNHVLNAFEADLIAKQRERRRRQSQVEPDGLPPMPADPNLCRWCGGRRRLLIADDPESSFCQNLCAKNDQAPYLVQCVECGKDFHTGLHHATVCPSCDETLQGERTEQGATYTRDAWAERRRAR